MYMWKNCAFFPPHKVYFCVSFDYHDKYQLFSNSINQTFFVVDTHGFLRALGIQYLLTTWMNFLAKSLFS